MPLAVLSLTHTGSLGLIASHLAAAASQWPPAVAARVVSYRVLPLLPQAGAEASAAEALRELARQPPAVWLTAAGCTSPLGPGSALGHAGGALVGAPVRVGVELAVKEVLEASISMATSAPASTSTGGASMHPASRGQVSAHEEGERRACHVLKACRTGHGDVWSWNTPLTQCGCLAPALLLLADPSPRLQ